MKHNEGQSPIKGSSPADSVWRAGQPEFTPLHWIHVIYDHSDDTDDLEHDLESSPPLHRTASMHSAFFAE